MKTVTVTIGRNVKATPLSTDEWATFVNRAKDSLVAFESQINGLDSTWTETHFGTGTWDGVPEDSAKVTLFYETATGTFTSGEEQEAEDELRQTLAALATRFGQDAIALNFGHSVLISAKAGE